MDNTIIPTIILIIYLIIIIFAVSYTISPDTINSIICKIKSKNDKPKVKNKFMDMTVIDFEKYMASVLVAILLQNIELYISAVDKKAPIELQVRGYVAFLSYFDDISQDIALYYGDNYMKNFYDLSFNKLLVNGEISNMIYLKGIK